MAEQRKRPSLADVVAQRRAETPPERRVKVSLNLPLSIDLRLTMAAKRAGVSKRAYVESLLGEHLPPES